MVCGSSNGHVKSLIWATDTIITLFTQSFLSSLQTTKALARLQLCAGSPEPLLVACMVSTLFSCAGSFFVHLLLSSEAILKFY